MKNILIGIGILIVIVAVLFIFGGTSFTNNESSTAPNTESMTVETTVTPGTYTVAPEQSKFNWAGQKPFIDGYVNSGTIAVTEGTIEVGEATASGSFVLDMNTLEVGLTAKKPGQEGALEGHLKVATYPTATFVITNVTPTENTMTSSEYVVTGNLTMKGVTNEISFPARIYQTADGNVHAEADTEIDRTRWGITVGSGSFFDNLGDNLIDDMVAISFSLVATPEN